VAVDRCPLCGDRDLSVLYPSNLPAGRGARSGRGRYECTSSGLGIHPDILRCASCSLVFNEPAPVAGDHLQAYATIEDPEYLEQRASRRLTFERELERIERLARGRRLLDVGCYAGFFLEVAREHGFEVAGVEPSLWAARHAAGLGLRVANAPIEAFDQRPGVEEAHAADGMAG